MSKHTGRHPRQGAYVDGGAAEDVQHHRMQDHTPGGTSGDGVALATTATASGTDPGPESAIGLPDTAAGPPTAAGLRTRRRRVTITVALLALVLAVALAVFGSRAVEGPSVPVPTQGGWDGDWKDSLVGDGAREAYSGDWKDALVGDGGRDPYSGDWKDGLVE